MKKRIIIAYLLLAVMVHQTWATLTHNNMTVLDALLLALDFDADGSITDETWYQTFLSKQDQPVEGPFEDGDKTLLDSALQPEDATDTMDPDGSPNDLPKSDAVRDYGDANWADIVTGTDPDQAAGQLGQDTDGASVSNDQTIRATDATGNQWPVGRKLVNITFPFSTTGSVTAWQPWTNETGMTMTLTRIFCRSDTDDLGIDIDEFTSITNSTILNNIVDVTVDANGTGVYYKTTAAASMTDTQIETQHGVSFDIDAAAEGFITLEGWFDANVD